MELFAIETREDDRWRI